MAGASLDMCIQVPRPARDSESICWAVKQIKFIISNVNFNVIF